MTGGEASERALTPFELPRPWSLLYHGRNERKALCDFEHRGVIALSEALRYTESIPP